MTYYEAKFAREAKERPVDWVIAPIISEPGLFKLVQVGNL